MTGTSTVKTDLRATIDALGYTAEDALAQAQLRAGEKGHERVRTELRL